MYEKVNPGHPDKIADRIAGALVDMAYKLDDAPKMAVEVLIGHGVCHIIAETSVLLSEEKVRETVERIAGENLDVIFQQEKQDPILNENQQEKIKCGDNGIFRGCPITKEQATLTAIAKAIYYNHPYDGKYILDGKELIICQSNTKAEELTYLDENATINPLGYWTGGLDVDTGATNRKIGSDMGDAITGGGLHGKDLSKADVSLNIYCHLKAQETGEPVELYCAIGDDYIDGRPYEEIVKIARTYIAKVGGFEKFAEWGLIR